MSCENLISVPCKTKILSGKSEERPPWLTTIASFQADIHTNQQSRYNSYTSHGCSHWLGASSRLSHKEIMMDRSPFPHSHPSSTQHSKLHSAGVRGTLAEWMRHQTICRGRSGCQVPHPHPAPAPGPSMAVPPQVSLMGPGLPRGRVEKPGTSRRKGRGGLAVSRKSEDALGQETPHTQL